MVSCRSVLDRHQDPFENHKSRVRIAMVQAFGQRPPPRRSRFDPSPIKVRLVVDTVALEQIFSQYFGFPCQYLPTDTQHSSTADAIHLIFANDSVIKWKTSPKSWKRYIIFIVQSTKLRRLKPRRLRQTGSMLGRSTFGNYQNLQKSIRVALSTYVIIFFTTLVRSTFGCSKHLES